MAFQTSAGDGEGNGPTLVPPNGDDSSGGDKPRPSGNGGPKLQVVK